MSDVAAASYDEAPRRRPSARQAGTVEKLLAAGLDELRAVGHEALTVRGVAQRAGVSPATAYTYLASKHHLAAELFRRHLRALDLPGAARGDDDAARLRAVLRRLSDGLVAEPSLTAAVTPALLGTDPDVVDLRVRIGAMFVAGFDAALADPEGEGGVPAGRREAVLDALVLSLSGALLQAGTGMLGYDQVADRLGAVVDLVVGGAR